VVFGNLDDLHEVAIGCFGFIGVGAQQRIEHPADVAGGGSAHDERVEAVEGADGAQGHIAPLGRIGIDVRKVGEVRRQSERAQQRKSIGASLCVRGAGGQQAC